MKNDGLVQKTIRGSFHLVLDKVSMDLHSEITSKQKKYINVNQVISKQNDEYEVLILHGNFVQGSIDTATDATKSFVSFVNLHYKANKIFELTKNIRTLEF